MPTVKKRINLSIPDAIYERLQAYKEKNGIVSDATACLQLITQQLNGQEQVEQMVRIVRSLSMDDLMKLSHDGIALAKETLVASPPGLAPGTQEEKELP